MDHYLLLQCFAFDPHVWGTVPELVGAVIAICSLGFILKQLRSVQISLQTSAYAVLWKNWIEIDRFFSEKPSLRPYFYNDKSLSEEDPAKPERISEIKAAMEMVLDSYAGIYHIRTAIPKDDLAPYYNFMKNTYSTQHAFQEFVNSMANFYDPKFMKLLGVPDDLIKTCVPTRTATHG
jgi:hypothetical protein